jgi:hypothetical protein
MARVAISIPVIEVSRDFWKKRPEISSCWAKNNFLPNTKLSLDICKVERDNIDSQKDSGQRAQTVGDGDKSVLYKKFDFSTHTCIVNREMILEDVVLEGVPVVFGMNVIANEFLNVRVKIDN